MGRMMERTKRLAERVSSFISRRVLSLVSTASTMFSGRSDSRSKTLMAWGTPSSSTLKSSLVRSPTGEPRASVTEANTFTSRTFTLNVLSSAFFDWRGKSVFLLFGAWAEQREVTSRMAKHSGNKVRRDQDGLASGKKFSRELQRSRATTKTHHPSLRSRAGCGTETLREPGEKLRRFTAEARRRGEALR